MCQTYTAKKVRYYPWSSSSYGEPDGILGINCGHFCLSVCAWMYHFNATSPTEDMAENDQLYKQSQKQRAFERDIRSAKRECMMFDELGDKEQFEKSAVKLKNKRDKLNDFIQGTGRTKHSDREQVVGFDRSLSAKATAAQKRVAKRSDSGIIKVDKASLSKYIGQDIKDTDSQHVREWYYANVTDIPNQVDKTKPFEEQVKQAFGLRNKYKHEARVAMSDVEKAAELEALYPAPNFDKLLEDKMRRKNLTYDEALRDILKTASKTNPNVNKEFGL